jgi:outer membrane protein
MRFYSTASQTSLSFNAAARIVKRVLALTVLAPLALVGCANYGDQPELNPRRWAPAAVEREWSPPPDAKALVASPPSAAMSENFSAPERSHRLALSELITLALQRNPSTRSAWHSAEAAAAEAGEARAPFYPVISTQSVNGYQRLVDLVPKHWGTLKTWQSRSQVALDYDLLDFGRRDAAASSALNQVIAANLLFNRTVQQVVFNVKRSYYELDAAEAGVDAAEATLKLASTDRTNAERRQQHGLATQPEVLLARQRDAQAGYDLENARLAVSLAQADLAVALGMRAGDAPDVERLSSLPLPSSLGADVEQLMDNAVRERPDLAAKVSIVRAKQADVALARAQLYPTLGFTSFYGAQAFTYRLSNPATPTFTALAPEYGAGVTLKWDVFTGFSRVNSIRQAEAEQDAARADLTSAELDVAANVWRAYYSYLTARRKYEYAEALLAASESSYNSNFRSYGLGLANIIDLLSAERELASARFTIIQSKAELLISAAAVSFATGAIAPQAKP